MSQQSSGQSQGGDGARFGDEFLDTGGDAPADLDGQRDVRSASDAGPGGTSGEGDGAGEGYRDSHLGEEDTLDAAFDEMADQPGVDGARDPDGSDDADDATVPAHSDASPAPEDTAGAPESTG